MKTRRIALLALIVLLVVAFFALDLERFVSLSYFKLQREAVESYFQAHPWRTAGIYFLAYVAVTGLSLPGAAIMTLIGGAIFGLVWGTVLVSFASSIGATCAFLVSRLLLRDLVQRRFGRYLRTINRGIERDGAFYLFAVRLVPAFPFFVINLVMGLTPMRTLTFYAVSQVGMLAGTLVYVNAGTRIAHIESPEGVLSPALLGSFILLGVFPLIARKVVDGLRARRSLHGYSRPPVFDRDLVVIGAGSAGLSSAYLAAALRARVSLVEQHRFGGDCLNTGCVPSKALIRSARFLADARRASELGFRSARIDFDFADVMERVQRVVSTVAPHDSVERYTRLGVDCIQGRARIVSPWTVAVGERTLTARSIIVATGARPLVPRIPGIERIDYLTSDTLWGLRELPERLLVLGAGPIGCELSQAFARLGSRVTQVEMQTQVLPREDPDIAELVAARLRAEGVDLRLGYTAREFRSEHGRQTLVATSGGEEARLEFDRLLVAVGRVPDVRGYGLEEMGVALTDRGSIEVNEFLQTRFPNIYACGDVASPFQFTHTASHESYYAVVNALFGTFRKSRVNYSVIPWAVFTDPELARVGLNEREASAQGIPYEVTRYGLDELDRAITEEAAAGVVKVLTAPGKDHILGVCIVAEHAGDIISEYVLAMRRRLGLNKILGTIHIYPTLAEANRYAAGAWKRTHAPAAALRVLERYHAWRRRDRRASA